MQRRIERGEAVRVVIGNIVTDSNVLIKIFKKYMRKKRKKNCNSKSRR